VLVAHGGGPAWNARVDSLAELVDDAFPTRVALLMGKQAAARRFQDQVAALRAAGAQRIVVVPVLMSSHSGHYEQVRYLTGRVDTLSEVMAHHLAMAGIERPDDARALILTPALDGAPELAPVVAERALRAAGGDLTGRAVLLMGHGPSSAVDYAAWMQALRALADSVRERAGAAHVAVGLVRDDAPEAVRAEAVRHIRDLVELQERATGYPVVVVPLLVARGYLSERKFPADLEGLEVDYTPDGVLPHPALAAWVRRRVMEALRAPAAATGPVERSAPADGVAGLAGSPHGH